MSAADFFDTNVLVYMVDRRDPAKQTIAQQLVSQALASNSGIISFQVVQETLHALTRKARQVLPAADANELLRAVLVPLWSVQPSASLYEKALQVQAKQGFSFYDSLIVSAALEAGCKRLFSEDLQHGQKVGGLRIENPFLR
jgi:predicted nucleic acid-binding protein